MKKDDSSGPYFLAIETATAFGSVAVFNGSQLVGSIEMRRQQSHARLLMPMIEQLLGNLDLKTSDLSAIGVSKGPGSYTGLRVGVSTAKGLCFALQLPLISFSTLTSLAWNQRELASRLRARVIPMIDARRMEVYCAPFNAQGIMEGPIEAKVIEEGAFSEELAKGPVIFCGDGAEKCRHVLEKSPEAIVLGQAFPSATHAGGLISRDWENQAFVDLVSFEPFYLKDFRATQPKDPLRQVRGRKP